MTGSYFYPDIVGICGKPAFETPAQVTLLNPVLLAEVLSPTTEKIDRGRKLMHYQQIPSLREYVLISQDEPAVEIYSRGENGEWIYRTFLGMESTAPFASIGCNSALSRIYRGIEFQAAEAG